MLKKINLYIIIFLILLSYVIINLNFSYYNLIDYIDRDEGFLIEQLILKLGIYDIPKNITSAAEYGIDFYYFKYFFLILNQIVDLKIIDIFKIKTLINSCFALFSYVVIYKIFDLLNFKKIFYFLFLISILSIPEVFRLSVSLKPDLNLLLFFVTLTYYFFLKSSIYKIKSDAYLFLIFLSLSLSIKAWAFPFILLLFFDKFNYSNNNLKSSKWIFFGLIIFFIFLLNSYFFVIKYFISNNNDFLSFYDLYKYNIFLKTLVNIFNNYFYFLIIFSNIFFLICLKIITSQNKFKDYLLKFFIFLMLWFIIWYPYISNLSTFTKTIIETSYATTLNAHSSTYSDYEGIISHIIKDLMDLKINLVIFIFFTMSPFFMYFYRINLLNYSKILIPLLSLCIFSLLFVNFITDYGNQYPAKYLYFIFINIFVFYLVNLLSNIKYLYYPFLSIFLITSLMNVSLNFDKYLNYTNFLKMNDQVNSLVSLHQEKLNLDNKKLYTCGKNYPVDTNKSEIYIIGKNWEACLEKQFILNLNSDDFIVFETSHLRSEEFSKKYTLFYEDYHYVTNRFGKIINKSNQFYKKAKIK